MMSSVDVSVVLPVKDGGDYLAQAVESILGQTLNSFELLVIDDHSSDGAVEQLARTDPRLRVLKSDGHGVVSAFNLGLRNSRGPIIARMDADDIALPERLEVQLDYLHSNLDVDIAGACVEIFSDEGLGGGNIHYQQWLNSVQSPEQVHQALFIESPIPNPTAIFRRDTLLQLGGYREVEWPEDYDLFLRADRAGIAMGKPDGILLNWREHDGRLTHTDERYSRLHFQQAKAHFLAQGRLPDVPLLILGAGPTGRQLYDLLLSEGRMAAGFIDVHPRRIGGMKRDKPVWGADDPSKWPDGFILVAVGSRGARVEISEFLSSSGRRESRDYLFVA